MQVQELIKVLPWHAEIFIKPHGHRLYFHGRANHIPKDLLTAEIVEIAGSKGKPSDNTSFCLWVKNLDLWDVVVDRKCAMSDGEGFEEWPVDVINDLMSQVTLEQLENDPDELIREKAREIRERRTKGEKEIFTEISRFTEISE